MTGRITSIKRAKPGQQKFIKGCGVGFGFIQDANKNDYFFPIGNVVGCRFEDLQEGLTVEFEPVDGMPGKGPRAMNVRVIS